MITPIKNSPVSKKNQIADMFNNISGRYDFLNHFLSLGVDRYWRRRLVRSLYKLSQETESSSSKGLVILDAATGTADLAIEVSNINPKKIFGVDISEKMIAIGREKIRKKNLSEVIELIHCDSENLIFDEHKFDAVTVAFGVRNFENLLKGLQEFYRVLKPGGMVFILEFSQPRNKLFRKFYHFYSSKILPRLGKKISGNDVAYRYLHESVEAFPSGDDFLKFLTSAGFTETNCTPLTFGVVSVYAGKKI